MTDNAPRIPDASPSTGSSTGASTPAPTTGPDAPSSVAALPAVEPPRPPAADAEPVVLLGLGAMGTALARAWRTAGHPLTVWNRSPGPAEAFAGAGTTVASTAAEAVAAGRLVVVCLLDDASVDEVLDGVELRGKDLVNLTTSTPAEARARERWASARGARFLDGGVMAVPPMIGAPESGAYVFFSGSSACFEAHRNTLAVPAGVRWVGEDAGHAALHDVALLSAMSGMFAGMAHAFALVHGEGIDPRGFAGLLGEWLAAMSGAAQEAGEKIATGDYRQNVVSSLAMQEAGNATLLRTAREQKVSEELLAPYAELMRRMVDEGRGDEDGAGLFELLRR